ncbi:MAG TPA: carbohydrate binding family 9 domain-containing protein, partial [Candidatus Angelobacter sp.]|nr:carbohydrate binding family 9 domain-containing protein [Candidatus Angelobacter sp.]
MLRLRFVRLVIVLSSVLATAQLASHPPSAISASGMNASVIPKVASVPKLTDFEGMRPTTELARSMLKIDRFTQRDPHDGAPASQRTEAYLGYTDKDFYVIFLAFDSEPKKIRARMLRRELIDDDDQVGMYLDTFHDRRHAYYFYSNPYGIQQDGLFAESGGPDNSFDTVWHTDAKMTSQGYMVMFEIPFKSLRFPQRPSLSWGVFLVRVIPRNSEHYFYPI